MPATIVQPGGSRGTFANVLSDPQDVPTSPDNRIDLGTLGFVSALSPILGGIGRLLPGVAGDIFGPVLGALGEIPRELLLYDANADAAAEANRRRDLALSEVNRFDPQLTLPSEYDINKLMLPYAQQVSRMNRTMSRDTRSQVNETQARLGPKGVGANQVAKAVAEVERKGSMGRFEALGVMIENMIKQKNNYSLGIGRQKLGLQEKQIGFDAARLGAITSILMAEYNIPGADAIGSSVNSALESGQRLQLAYDQIASAESIAADRNRAGLWGAGISGVSTIASAGLLRFGGDSPSPDTSEGSIPFPTSSSIPWQA